MPQLAEMISPQPTLPVDHRERFGNALDVELLGLASVGQLCKRLRRQHHVARNRLTVGRKVLRDVLRAALVVLPLIALLGVFTDAFDKAVGKQIVDGNRRVVDVAVVLMDLVGGIGMIRGSALGPLRFRFII